jgi:large subunit ribosomal protein L21
MYAVIKTGGKQYRVAADEVFEIEKVEGDPGSVVNFGEVLMLGGNGGVTVGKPVISGASVTAEILEQGRGPKTINFKKRRRKNSRRKKGHRQDLTTVRILEVLAAGQSASKKATGVGVVARAFRGNGRSFEVLKAPEGRRGDDLSLIGGVGPKYVEALNKAGIFHMWQVAAMTKQNIAALEATGHFGGHIAGGEWVQQAQELINGKAPRAKIDQAKASA